MSLLVLDLIDTLWNVKDAVAPDAVVAPLDLIDTLWNVKSLVVIGGTPK